MEAESGASVQGLNSADLITLDMVELCKRAKVDRDHGWGYQIRFVNNGFYSGKFLVLTNRHSGSFHFHHNKTETFIVLAGTVAIATENNPDGLRYEPGDVVTFKKNVAHRMWGEDIPVLILEVSTHDEDSDTYMLRHREVK